MGLHFYVKFQNDALYTNITQYIKYDSVKFDINLCNENFESVQDAVSARTIYDQWLNSKFFEATTWMPAYIMYDLQEEQMYGYTESDSYEFDIHSYGFLSEGRIFTGAVYPNTKEKLTDFPNDGVSFEIVDNNYRLDIDTDNVSIPTSISDVWYVYNPLDTDHSFIHKLLLEAGFVIEELDSSFTILDVLPPLTFEKNDKTYYEIISELLYEHIHVHYFDENGIFRLYRWKHNTISISDTIDESDIQDSQGVIRERNIYDYDGYEIEYNPLTLKENALIYREDLPIEGKLLLSGQAFPTDGESKDIFQKYSTDWLHEDAKIVFSSNHTLQTTKDISIDIITQNFNIEDAQIVFKNNGAIDARLFQFDIRADVYFEDGEEKLIIPNTAHKKENIKLEHVRNNLLAERFGEAIHNNTIKYGLYTYSFRSIESYTIGTMYTIDTRDYDVNVLIIEKSFNYYEHIYQYICIGIGQNLAQVAGTYYMRPPGNASAIALETRPAVTFVIRNNVDSFPE